MKKKLKMMLAVSFLTLGFGVAFSPVAAGPLTCFQQCRTEWRACTSDPCACATIFEYCLAECE